jgi:hypothetical protein
MKTVILHILAGLFLGSSQVEGQGLEGCLALQKQSPTIADFRCSIPEWAPKLFVMPEEPGKVFHFPCVVHDLCYIHGSYTYSFNRRTCDDDFRDRMIRICETRFEAETEVQFRCRIDVNTIYETVRAVGFIYYWSKDGFNDFPQGVQPYTNDYGSVCRYLD